MEGKVYSYSNDLSLSVHSEFSIIAISCVCLIITQECFFLTQYQEFNCFWLKEMLEVMCVHAITLLIAQRTL